MKYLKNRNSKLKQLKNLLPLFIFTLLLSHATVAQHFQAVWSNNPFQPMNIIVDSANLDGVYLQLNDEIAVFDVDLSGDEYCVGVIAMVGEFLPDTNYIVIAATDDPDTPELDGFVDGHDIIYRYWDDSEGEEFVLFEVTYHPSLNSTYLKLGTALLGLEGYAALTWTGIADNTWNNVANWSLTRTPDTATHVVIPTGLTNYPTLSAAGECNNLKVQSDNTGDASILGDGLLTVDGMVTVERYVSGGKWHDISAPVTGQTAHSLYLDNNPKVWLKTYNEPSNTRTNITNLSTPMPPGLGFEVWVETGNNATFSFDGPLQTTDVTLTSGTTPPLSFSGPHPYGYNLIGNPFASPLDWDIGSWNLTDVDATVWVWDPTAGSYKDRVGGTGSLTGGIIPLGQGFFVQATSPAASISIPIDARVHSSQAYYKSTSATNEVPDHFSIKAIKGEKNDELNIVFAPDATEGYDNGRDAKKMFAWDGNAPQINAVQSGETLSINGLPLLTEEGRTVQFNFAAGLDGEQTLIANAANLPETEILLEDLFTGNMHNLIENPVYEFEAFVSDDANRFLLHFNPMIIGVDDKDDDSGVYVYAYNGSIYIRSNGKAAMEQKEVFVYDLLGRNIFQTSVSPAVLSKIPISSSSGFLVVKTQGENITNTTKVFIK